MTTTSKTTKATCLPVRQVCLVPGCDRPAKNRGVCGACYIHWVNRRDDPTDRTRAIVAVMLPPGPHGGHRRGKGAKATMAAAAAAGNAAGARPGPQVCLVRGCDRRAKTRGVCKPCYVYAAKDKNNSTDRSRAIKAAMLPPTRRGGGRPACLPAGQAAPASRTPSEAAKILSLLKLFGVDLVEFPTPAGHRFINADNGREVLLEAETGKLVSLDVQPAACE